MKILKINKYEELEKMNEEQAKKAAFKNGVLKDSYNYYFIKTEPYFGVALLVFGGGGVPFYINSQIHYSHICEINETEDPEKQEQLLKRLFEMANYSIFNIEELKTVKNYAEYREKIQFISNSFKKIRGGVSYFASKKPSTHKYFSALTFSSFETMEQLEEVESIYKNLQNLHFKKLNNNLRYFKGAVSYEISNYEVVIGGRMNEALEAVGIDPQSLTNEQKQIINDEYDRQLRRYNEIW